MHNYRAYGNNYVALSLLIRVAVLATMIAAPAFVLQKAASAASGSDLSVELVTVPFGAEPAQPVTHRLVVRNSGPDTAAATVLTFATSVTAVSPTTTTTHGACVAANGQVTCELGDLAPTGAGSPPTVTIAVPPGTQASGALVKNVGSVRSSTADPNAANNTSVNGFLSGSPALPQEVALVASTTAAAPEPVEVAVAQPEIATGKKTRSLAQTMLMQPWYVPFVVGLAFMALLFALRLAVRTATRLVRRAKVGRRSSPYTPRHRVSAAHRAGV